MVARLKLKGIDGQPLEMTTAAAAVGTIRLATADDVEQLLTLVNWAYRGKQGRHGWTKETHLVGGLRTDRESLATLFTTPQTYIHVLVVDGSLVGCIKSVIEGDIVHIGMFAVDPDKQSRGYGGRLLTCLLTHATQLSCSTAVMTVLSARPDLIRMYASKGFLDTGERQPFPPRSAAMGWPLDDVPLQFAVLAKSL
eukprot:TRINITY_DN319_c0_g1_i2.p1 TRINITY_DN319_c0_g1~~TRINITY_DN319_c0_g1_i2.p1  ORF type:complete len:196 (-),score=7.86 TRINITY_DN319_c0_g1_i2:102-689(-)